MIRLAIAGPDGAGKSTVCLMLLNRLHGARLQYAGKNNNHLLKSTSLCLKLWAAMTRRGPVLHLIGQYFLFYPFEYLENYVRFRRTFERKAEYIIYDRHPIDRMVLKHDTVIRRKEGKIKFSRFVVEHPLRWFWGCVYRYAFPDINRVYVLLPSPELCFERSGGQYQNLDEARIRIETYRRAIVENRSKYIAIDIDRDQTVENICQFILTDINTQPIEKKRTKMTFQTIHTKTRGLLKIIMEHRLFCKFQTSFINILSRMIRQDSKLVLFGATNGQWYGDNSRHLYEWVLANRPDMKPVWLTKNRSVYDMLIQQARPVAFIYSKSGVMSLIRARAGVFTSGLRDLAINPFLLPDRLRLIALRHGRSVKRVRFARLGHHISQQEAAEREREGDMIEFAISTSPFVSTIQEECLQIGNKHVVTGYPRNDRLLSSTRQESQFWLDYLDGIAPSKIILYGPSWRHGRAPTRFFPFDDFNKKGLIHFLKERNILLLLRPHANDLRQYPTIMAFLKDLEACNDHVRIASHDHFPDVNILLPFVDILISDYSALYHDFLLLDRPFLFIPYDYKEFEAQNGFLYDYFENLPGPSVDTFRAFCSQIDRICNGEDPFAEKRRKLTDKIYSFKDNRSCERVTELIDWILASDA